MFVFIIAPVMQIVKTEKNQNPACRIFLIPGQIDLLFILIKKRYVLPFFTFQITICPELCIRPEPLFSRMFSSVTVGETNFRSISVLFHMQNMDEHPKLLSHPGGITPSKRVSP